MLQIPALLFLGFCKVLEWFVGGVILFLVLLQLINEVYQDPLNVWEGIRRHFGCRGQGDCGRAY